MLQAAQVFVLCSWVLITLVISSFTPESTFITKNVDVSIKMSGYVPAIGNYKCKFGSIVIKYFFLNLCSL